VSGTPPYVIVIAGTSGAGKSTLVQATASLLHDAVTFHFDDYASVSHYPADAAHWLAEGADPDAWQTPEFLADLCSLRSGQPVTLPRSHRLVRPGRHIVVEEPFGRARRGMADLADFVVFIDLPLELALARRLLRDVTVRFRPRHPLATMRANERALEHVRHFLTDYLDDWRDAYAAVNRIALQQADLVIDGRLPTDVLARTVVDTLHAERLQMSRGG
jgi:uridine kinase